MCSHIKFWRQLFYHTKLVFFTICKIFSPGDWVLDFGSFKPQCWPSNVRIKSLHNLLKALSFAKTLVKFVPYTCIFRYFFNISSYIYEPELGCRVDECHYYLNSRTCLNRKHYIMLPPHCSVLVSFRLCSLHTNISTASCLTTLYHEFTVLKWHISSSF